MRPAKYKKKKDSKFKLTCFHYFLYFAGRTYGHKGICNPQETPTSVCWQWWQLGTSRLIPGLTLFLSGTENVCGLRFQTHRTKNSNFPDRCLVTRTFLASPRASCCYENLGGHSHLQGTRQLLAPGPRMKQRVCVIPHQFHYRSNVYRGADLANPDWDERRSS